MRVLGPNQPGGSDRVTNARVTKVAARTEAPSKSGRSERTTVSDAARAAAAARAPEAPDELRVARLKAAIRDGKFHVDVEKIADAILRDEG